MYHRRGATTGAATYPSNSQLASAAAAVASVVGEAAVCCCRQRFNVCLDALINSIIAQLPDRGRR